MQIQTAVTSTELRLALRVLYAERELAALTGLNADPRYWGDLLDDITAHETALTGVAVTEIATLRAELGGALQG